MAKQNTEMVNDVTDLAVVQTEELSVLFGDKLSMPAILMFDEKKVVSPIEIINIASGENVSISDVLNQELVLQGMGAVQLDYVNEETGEFSKYIRYILITDKGNFTTTSTFIGRSLKMLYQVAPKAPKIMFKQKEKDGRRRFMMELVG